MKVRINTNSLEKQAKSCLMIGIYDSGELSPSAKVIDKASRGLLTKIIKQGAITGKIGQNLPLFHLTGTPFEQILLVGAGKVGSLSPIQFRKIMFGAVKTLLGSNITSATCYLGELNVGSRSLPWKVKQLTETTSEALYRFDIFKSSKEPAISLKELAIDVAGAKDLKACEQALKQGQAIADGVVMTKNLANLPSNVCTPTFLAEQARALGKQYASLNVKVLTEKDMEKLGMGALLAVSQGSAEEAKLICLEYKGPGAGKSAPFAFIGKGITLILAVTP